ncbi:MAG TPA: hypothetical protein VJT10_22030 [Steroidobacteraceae bacterium]|jgi:hypothetical protein|nr:hypothetical protein [Steroidobacteraceae bacterium]
MSKTTNGEGPVPTRPLGLRRGDLVEVRSAEEILATLDDSGAIDALPCMPELLEYAGQRFRVEARADKTCDTINYSGSRRLFDTVHLEGIRCSGKAHGGCEAQCSVFWKEAWLKRVEGKTPAPRPTTAATAPTAMTRERLAALTQRAPEAGETDVRYRCQATDLLLASTPIRWWDLRQYWRDVWTGNVGLLAVVRAALFRIFLKTLRIGGYRAQMWCYNRLQAWRGATPYPYTQGTLDKTPCETLDLTPGEYVRVKEQHEILKTVNARNRNRGLSFDPEMVRYCGKVHEVRARVGRIIDERNGKMLPIASDCIILEGAVCCAEYSNKRLFCPRRLYPYWREIWLERVPAPTGAPQTTQTTT